MHLSWIFALQPTVSGKLMTYQLLLLVNRRYLQYNDYSKVYCSSTLICPIQSIFWKAKNRQAIDSYDDSECNSIMPREGSYRFYWIQDNLLSVPSAENLFQYKHFHENLKWTAVRARKPGIVS